MAEIRQVWRLNCKTGEMVPCFAIPNIKTVEFQWIPIVQKVGSGHITIYKQFVPNDFVQMQRQRMYKP